MDIYRKEIPGVDIFKYVMAIAVIAIHVSACSDGEIFPIVQRWFDSLAVPFFFFVSGFFLARKISGVTSVSDKSNIIRKRSIEAFRLFIIWALLYFPISLSITLTDAPDLIKVIPRMTVRLLIQGEMPYAWPLWFLYSMAWITLAVSYVINKPTLKSVLIITVVLFYLGYFFKREYGICEISTYISMLYKLLPFRVLGGGIYLLAGFNLFKCMNRLCKIQYPIVMLIVSLILYLFRLPFSELFGGCGLFLISFMVPCSVSKRSSIYLRMQSMWIYFIHMYVIILFTVVARYFMFQLFLWPTFIAVSSVTMAVAYVIVSVSEKPRFAWLRQLVK